MTTVGRRQPSDYGMPQLLGQVLVPAAAGIVRKYGSIQIEHCVGRVRSERVLILARQLIGSWTNIAIFTDDSLIQLWLDVYMSDLRYRYVYPCNTSQLAAYQVIPRGDYVNVFIFCSPEWTTEISRKVTKELDLKYRFNWLLINISRPQFEEVQHDVRDGDNMVGVSLDLNQDLGQTDALLEADIFWCFYNCYRGTSPKTLTGLTLSEPLASDNESWLAELLPDRFKQFNGAHLIVTFGEYDPFCFKVTNSTTYNRETMAGIEIEMIDVIAENLNFSYELVETIDGHWGSQLPNGSFNGMVGMIARKEADVAICGISQSAARASVIDYLHPHWEDPSVVIVRLKSDKSLYFIQPFTPLLWLTVAVLPPGLAFCTLVFGRLSTRIKDGDSISLTQSDSGSETRTVLPSLCRWLYEYYECCTCTYSVILLQGVDLKKRSWPVYIVIGSLWLVVIALYGVYTGNLTASLTVPKVKMPFDGLWELAEDRAYDLIVQRGTITHQLFQDGNTALYSAMMRKLESQGRDTVVDDYGTGIMSVVIKDKVVFTTDKTLFINFVKSCSGCENLVLMKDEYNKVGLAMVVRKNTPSKKRLDQIIISLQENGLMVYWAEKYLYKKPPVKEELSALKFEDIFRVCTYVFGFGFAFAFSALFLEIITWVIMRMQ